jgi:hypothetical protein
MPDRLLHRTKRQLSSAVLIVGAVVLLCTGCSPYRSSDYVSEPRVTCDEVLASVVSLVRSGDPDGAINSRFDWLADNCSNEYEIAVDYASSRGLTAVFDAQACATLTEHVRAEAMALLNQDGFCSSNAANGLLDDPSWQGGQPGGGIAWSDAIGYAGSSQRVCGPLVDSGSSQDDVFLDLGLPYPDQNRFQLVIWDVGGLEPIAYGSTLCTSGLITVYEGVAQIELYDPGLIEIYE